MNDMKAEQERSRRDWMADLVWDDPADEQDLRQMLRDATRCGILGVGGLNIIWGGNAGLRHAYPGHHDSLPATSYACGGSGGAIQTSDPSTKGLAQVVRANEPESILVPWVWPLVNLT